MNDRKHCVACDHQLAAHQDAETGKVGRCRITGCNCEAWAEEPATAPVAGPRRVCVDVPDGYVLSISLIPNTGEA